MSLSLSVGFRTRLLKSGIPSCWICSSFANLTLAESLRLERQNHVLFRFLPATSEGGSAMASYPTDAWHDTCFGARSDP